MAGVLRADGVDVHERTGDEARAGIAWCGARTYLFDSTLRANLRVAGPDATDAALLAALRRARELLATTYGRTALIVTHRPDQTPGLPVVELRPTSDVTWATAR